MAPRFIRRMRRRVFPRRFRRRVGKTFRTYVRRAIKSTSEHKQFAWQFTGFAPMSTGVGNKFVLNWNRGLPNTTVVGTAVDTVTPFVLGSGPYQRIGAEINILKAEFRCDIQQNASAVAGMVVRVIFLVDKSPENVTFQSADLLYDVGATLAVYSPFKEATRHEFTILSDRLYVLKQAGPAVGGSVIPVQVKWSHTFKRPLKVKYYPSSVTGAEGSEGGIQLGGLCCVMYADVANGASSNIYSNIIYTDA